MVIPHDGYCYNTTQMVVTDFLNLYIGCSSQFNMMVGIHHSTLWFLRFLPLHDGYRRTVLRVVAIGIYTHINIG